MCQIVTKRDKIGILEIVSEIRQKINSSSSPFRGKKNSGGWTFSGSELMFFYFRERVCNFSLRSQTIGVTPRPGRGYST